MAPQGSRFAAEARGITAAGQPRLLYVDAYRAVVTGEGRVVALLPAAERADVERSPLVWKRAGQEPVPLRLERIEPRALSRAETGSLAAGVFARRPRPDSCLVVWAVPAPGLPPVTGEGSVALPPQERRLVDLFRREAR